MRAKYQDQWPRLAREIRRCQNLRKKHKLWRAGLKCATIGTYGSINLNTYSGASSKYEQSIGSLVEGI